jgi:hypothetical protein
VRQTTAPPLQALELTNGATLATVLKQASDKIISAKSPTAAALIDLLYQKMLSRLPTAAERDVAVQMVKSPTNCEGIEDLFWALTMLPEFQLIY